MCDNAVPTTTATRKPGTRVYFVGLPLRFKCIRSSSLDGVGWKAMIGDNR